MKRIMPLSIMLLLSLAFMIAPAQAKALVVPLHSDTQQCKVVVNTPSKTWPNFILEVSLKNSLPNTEYYVVMHVVYGPSLGYRPLGVLTTNMKGCGSFHHQGRLQPGYYSFYIRLFTEQPLSSTPPEQAEHSTDIIQIELH